MRSSSARISMPIAPCPTHGSITSRSKTVASRPSGTASPLMVPSALMSKFSRFMPASASMVASSSPRSATFCIRVATLPRISTMFKSGRAASNDCFRRVLLVAMVAPFGKSFSFKCGLKPRKSLWPGDQSACSLIVSFASSETRRHDKSKHRAHPRAWAWRRESGRRANPWANLSGCGRRGRRGL